MNAIRFFLPLLLSFSLCTNVTRPAIATKQEYVYLCEGPYSKVYHKSETCKGLSNCSTRIHKVTLEEAVKMGRRPCRIEYR
jgi:hypothetical protein